MSDGMSDAAAEGRIYSRVKCAVYDVRTALLGEHSHFRFERWPHSAIVKVNQIIASTGWRFDRAQYAEPAGGPDPDFSKLWDASFALRRALRELNWGHRGWVPVVDPSVEGLLYGSGYELRKLAAERE